VGLVARIWFGLALQFSAANQAGESPLTALRRWRVNILPEAPENASRINDGEIADIPRSVRRRLRPHAIFVNQSLSLNLAPPSLDVLNKQMHHEVFGVLLVVESLQEET
jgi:hypothetical protein